MKKRLALLLMVMLLLSGLPALAESTTCHIVGMQNALDRLKLRASPSTSATVLGKYFYGVEVTVLSMQGSWSQVSVGGRKGWMMSKFLSADTSEWYYVGDPCAILFPDDDGKIGLFDAPQTGAAELCRVKDANSLNVLGTIDDDWLHVRLTNSDGSYTYGFASSTQITQTSNFGTAVVDTGHAEQRVNIRKSPSMDAEKIGEYFSGTTVNFLFDNHVANDGWKKVRVGSIIGYINSDFLDNSSAGCPAYRTPVVAIRDSETPLYANQSDTSTDAVLNRNIECSILGLFGNRYQVRIAGDDPFSYTYGFIAKNAVESTPTRSAATTATLTRAGALYWYQDGGMVDSGYTLEVGARVSIYGAGYASNYSYLDPYITTSDVWLYVDAKLPDQSWVSAYLAYDIVDFDSGLLLPECMTLG